MNNRGKEPDKYLIPFPINSLFVAIFIADFKFHHHPKTSEQNQFDCDFAIK